MMPPDFSLINASKDKAKGLLLWSYSYYGGAATADIAGRMKEDGFRFATQAGISIGLDDIQRPPRNHDLLRRLNTSFA
jgi:DNA-directed RNA polymerase subunit beta'